MERIQHIVDTFEAIAKSDRTFEKQNAIMEILEEFNPEYIEGMGIIINNSSDEGVTKVIVSHYDLVGVFDKGFKAGRTLEFSDDDYVNGALDNTITNAVLINEILKNGLPENTMILFTDGEESGMWGMRAFMSASKENIDEMFFINLDVTNDNWDFMTSVEYDNPNKGISLQIDENIKAGFTTDRFADDMSAVVSAGGDGFSYCVPTIEYCHTYKSATTIQHLLDYEQGLTYLVQELNVQDKEPDGSSYIMGRVG